MKAVMNTWTGYPYLGKWDHHFADLAQRDKAKEVLEFVYGHGLKVLCRNNTAIWDYVYRWMAKIIQYPELPTGVAIVITGLQGSGKTFYFSQFLEMLGNNGLYLTDVQDIFARYPVMMNNTRTRYEESLSLLLSLDL